MPTPEDFEDRPPGRILVITAHPDDVDFGVAGSVATWTDAGAQVTYCVVTDGDAGGFDPAVPRSEIAGIRRAEQTAAAAEVGVSDLVFLGYPDGRLEVSMDLRRDLARVIRQVRPDRVVCQSPERLWDRIFASHPDHLAAGEAALCAVYPDARNPFTFPELLEAGHEAHAVGEVWIMAAPQTNVYVDVTDAFDRKVAALRAHVSQETDRDGKLADRMREWLAAGAERAGLPAGRMAESFFRVATA
ncbi:MAG TPA: PIG-L deacetylase family protein [Acidimicrobiales bacterium]|nr:PIG-L deacetylase family protein [Acidimicrobiales bacterium]